MNQKDCFDNLCKKCYIKNCRPSKDEIKKIIFTTYKDKCEKCGRIDYLVDYIEFD